MEKMERIKAWEKTEGIDWMRACGFKRGDAVLDFGSNIGHYVFPLARLVGEEGKVIAYDSNEKALSIIETYKQQESLFNIQTLLSTSNVSIPVEDQSLDGILFFDILHHLHETQDALVQESFRCLKNGGRLVILPFHFSQEDLNTLIQDITKKGFTQDQKVSLQGIHFEHYKNKLPKDTPLENAETGKILVFIKA